MRTEQNLTTGNITAKLWRFALPLMLGNVLQQFYNLADTWIVGRYIGDDALAAVGSSYTLMTFLTSVILGLCLGSSVFFAMAFGNRNIPQLKNGIFLSFLSIGACAILLTGFSLQQSGRIIALLQVPAELTGLMEEYLHWIFWGIFATFLYNFTANLLRGIGNSLSPLLFLGFSVLLNIGLDLYYVALLHRGIQGAAIATVISQYISGIALLLYVLIRYPTLHIKKTDMVWHAGTAKQIASLSGFTCLQQSVMNFGILTVQGLVNSFGTQVMAAFAVAVKIDTIAYTPVQDFGNAFSTFVAQNFGAGKQDRIRSGIRASLKSIVIFCLCISGLVCFLAPTLMRIFADSSEVIDIGVHYLRVEGAFYLGIGILFMLYGYYRGINSPKMSVFLTVLSLGTRVLLAYVLSAIPAIGVTGIWVAIPIGWFLADATGIVFYLKTQAEQQRCFAERE